MLNMFAVAQDDPQSPKPSGNPPIEDLENLDGEDDFLEEDDEEDDEDDEEDVE